MSSSPWRRFAHVGVPQDHWHVFALKFTFQDTVLLSFVAKGISGGLHGGGLFTRLRKQIKVCPSFYAASLTLMKKDSPRRGHSLRAITAFAAPMGCRAILRIGYGFPASEQRLQAPAKNLRRSRRSRLPGFLCVPLHNPH